MSSSSPTIPPACIGGLLAGTGAALVAANYHQNTTKVPSPCVAGTFAGAALTGSLLSHHVKKGTCPPATCYLYTAIGGVAMYGALSMHNKSSTNQVPPTCWLGTAAGCALLIAGTQYLHTL